MSNDILYRCELHDAEQGRQALRERLLPWVGEQLKQGRELVIEARLLDDDITQRQRGYLHAVVLTEISQFARPTGQQFPMPVWKEFFRNEFLGFKVVTAVNPMTRHKSRRRVRISTEDLGIRAMAEYIDRIIAYAATELNVQVSEPLPLELRGQRRRAQAIEQGNVDAETGEIPEVAA